MLSDPISPPSTTEGSISEPTFLSLFSGAGGFDLGLEQAGLRCVGQVEWDPDCLRTLEHRWPHLPRWADIRDVRGSDLPSADVIAFGSPCQDLSIAGKQQGLEGSKSGLFFEAIRIIQEMRNESDRTVPRAIIWENVAGALRSNRGADFQAVLQQMADIGALVTEWAVLDSRFFGVPQRRRRVFLVALIDPALASRCPDPLLPLRSSDPRDHQEGRVSKSLSSRDVEQAGWPLGSILGFDSTFGGNARFQIDTLPPLKVGSGLGIPSPPAIMRISDDPDDARPRHLTPLEAERAMGWPDDHTRWRSDGSENSDAIRYRLCGNGVVSPVAAWVGGHLAKLLERTS